jgi:Avidin family
MTETTSDQHWANTRTARSPVAGLWLNELGSRLMLDEPVDNALSGTYASSVGVTRDPQPLTGYCLRQRDGSAVIGFVVHWPAADSLATWTGRFKPGDDRILAEWILEAGATPSTAWQATRLGHDEFHRSDGE